MERKNNRSEVREMTSKNRTSQPISWPITLITFNILFVLRLKSSFSYSHFQFFLAAIFHGHDTKEERKSKHRKKINCYYQNGKNSRFLLAYDVALSTLLHLFHAVF